MAHESFEDDATAAQLNAEFVCVKVDREERPDVDAVYMDATVSMTGQGGWPMTVVLDHDGSPFFAGTYFPDRPRMGQPSLRQVLTALTEAWRDRPDDVRRAAASVREHLARQTALGGDALTADDLDAAVALVGQDFDAARGGFGGAPKFPPSMVLELLRRRPGADERAMLDATLEAMARGGIHDQLGGGFARYSVDDAWVVPHFEKMLYDNAQLVGLYARWGTPLGDRVATMAADFLLRELRTGRGRARLGTRRRQRGRGGALLRLDARPAHRRARRRRRPLGDRPLRGDRHLRARHVDPAAAARPGRLGALRRRTRPTARRPRIAGPAGPRRQGGRRLERAGDRRALRRRPAARPRGVRRRRARGGRPAGPAPPRRRPAPAGLPRRTGRRARGSARGLRRRGRRLPGPVRGHRRRALAVLRRRPCSTPRSTLFRADDGGFHDTPSDGERLVARPRDPSDNASPSGHVGHGARPARGPRPHR